MAATLKDIESEMDEIQMLMKIWNKFYHILTTTFYNENVEIAKLDPEFQQIKQVVADKLGRFYLLVRPGVYYYTVEEKQLDGSYLKVYQSAPINFGDGVLTSDISVK